jgi:hypothetical protein
MLSRKSDLVHVISPYISNNAKIFRNSYINLCISIGTDRYTGRGTSDYAFDPVLIRLNADVIGLRHGGIRVQRVPTPTGSDYTLCSFEHVYNLTFHSYLLSRLSLSVLWYPCYHDLLINYAFYTMASPAPPSPTSSKPVAATTTIIKYQDDAPIEKLKGAKLYILLGSITLVTFVALLDTSIVGTVSTFSLPLLHSSL